MNEGIEQPSPLNEDAAQRIRMLRKSRPPVEALLQGILAGDRAMLSQGITLVESSLPEHQAAAQQLITRCLPHAGKSFRIGITGVPGAGKSTFIEALGIYITGLGKRLAVLAIDPSSSRTKGSILGDKTRMEQLANDPNAFIRPSPAAGSLGGVARKTRESIILCEAAGFDTIFVETVGVGQSETAVHTMVDFFLLLMLAGAGDELQGIKRGIMEMADAIVINKADGDNITAAQRARLEYQNALHLFPMPPSGWNPRVETCSSLMPQGIDCIWEMILEYQRHTTDNGYFSGRRNDQDLQILTASIEEELHNRFYHNPTIKLKMEELKQQILGGQVSSYAAARKLTDLYFRLLQDHP